MHQTLITFGAAALLSACAVSPMTPTAAMTTVDNAALPEAVRAPAGARLRMVATGIGEITYECREKKDMAGQHEWAFVAPVATLYDSRREVVGRYFAGPTWEAADGSRVGGKQLAIAPAAPGSIPLQLVKADGAIGAGAMAGVSHIQRLNTQGGVAPAAACDARSVGQRRQVAYQADYAFYAM